MISLPGCCLVAKVGCRMLSSAIKRQWVPNTSCNARERLNHLLVLSNAINRYQTLSTANNHSLKPFGKRERTASCTQLVGYGV